MEFPQVLYQIEILVLHTSFDIHCMKL